MCGIVGGRDFCERGDGDRVLVALRLLAAGGYYANNFRKRPLLNVWRLINAGQGVGHNATKTISNKCRRDNYRDFGTVRLLMISSCSIVPGLGLATLLHSCKGNICFYRLHV